MVPVAHERKTALISGACGGLGRAIAEHFLQESVDVVVCDVNKELIADFKTKVSSAYPDRTLVIEADITSEAALDDLFAQALTVFGGLDYVVNSAGILDHLDPAGDVDKAVWDRVIAVNLTAPMMITQRAVKAWLSAGRKGVIVNISSLAGVRGFTAGVAYTTSKHGLIGLTRNTASFYQRKNIRCNAILAGGMQTNITSAFANGMNMDALSHFQKIYPQDLMQLCELEKMAKLVSYLCSDAAEIVNGSTLTADGGWTSGY
nr:dihydroanticapsin 7-dehydrogenase [Quercus suber]